MPIWHKRREIMKDRGKDRGKDRDRERGEGERQGDIVKERDRQTE